MRNPAAGGLRDCTNERPAVTFGKRFSKGNEIKAGRGKRTTVEPHSPITRARLKSGLTQAQFAALLGAGRRASSGTAKTLIRVAELHPEVLREIAA